MSSEVCHRYNFGSLAASRMCIEITDREMIRKATFTYEGWTIHYSYWLANIANTMPTTIPVTTPLHSLNHEKYPTNVPVTRAAKK